MFPTKIKSAASESIPNKVALIRPADQTWINGYIRKLIRKRKRLYRKAKRSKLRIHPGQTSKKQKKSSCLRD